MSLKSKDAAEFGFTGMGTSVLSLAVTPSSLLGHHGQTRTVHLDVHLDDRLSYRDRQFQLHGLPDGLRLAAVDVRANGLGHALHSLGGDLQIGQQSHLLTPMLERGALTAPQGQQAAHSRRKLGRA